MKHYQLNNGDGIKFEELRQFLNTLEEEGQVASNAKVNMLFDQSIIEDRIISVDYDYNSITFYNYF